MFLTPPNFIFPVQLVPIFEWEPVETPPSPPPGEGCVTSPAAAESPPDLRLVFKGYEWRAVGERMNEATSLNNSGHVYLSMQQFGEARPFFEQSLAISQSVGNVAGVASNTNGLGLVLAGQGAHGGSPSPRSPARASRLSGYTNTRLGRMPWRRCWRSSRPRPLVSPISTQGDAR